MERRKMPEIELEQIISAMERGDGICLVCGSEQSGVEPDADSYQCEQCGEYAVHGAEQILFMQEP